MANIPYLALISNSSSRSTGRISKWFIGGASIRCNMMIYDRELGTCQILNCSFIAFYKADRNRQ